MEFEPDYFHKLQTDLFVPTYAVKLRLRCPRKSTRAERHTFADGVHVLRSFLKDNAVKVLHVYPESFAVVRATWFGNGLPVVFTNLDGALVSNVLQQSCLTHALSEAR